MKFNKQPISHIISKPHPCIHLRPPLTAPTHLQMTTGGQAVFLSAMLMVCNVLVMMIVFVDTKVAVDESNAELEAERETAMLGAASASELVMEEGAADDEAGGDAGGGVEMVTVVTDQVNPILKESVPPPAPSASLAPPPTPATAAPTVVVAALPLEVTDEISIDLGHGDREQAPITGRRSSISNHVSWRTEVTNCCSEPSDSTCNHIQTHSD